MKTKSLERVFVAGLLRPGGTYRDLDELQEIVAGEYSTRAKVPTEDEALQAIMRHAVDWSELSHIDVDSVFSAAARAAAVLMDRAEVSRLLLEHFEPLMPRVMGKVRKNWAESFPPE